MNIYIIAATYSDCQKLVLPQREGTKKTMEGLLCETLKSDTNSHAEL